MTTGDSTTHFYNLKEGGGEFVYPGRQSANIFTLDQVNDAFDLLKTGNAGRIIVEIGV